MKKWEYGDPAYVAERRQQEEIKEKEQIEMATCHGCVDLARVFGVHYCISNQGLPGSNNLKRCKYFKRTKL